jgi:glycosyltransferase involved in cell wall biosynthesis
MGEKIRCNSVVMADSTGMTTEATNHSGTTAGKNIATPKVLLLSPLPPPEGGIATWTLRIMETEAFSAVNLSHVNTAIRRGHSGMSGSLLKRAYQSVGTIPKFLWICISNRPDVVHVTVSGFPGYYRDILYVLIASILRIKIILNLHFGDVASITSDVPSLVRPLVHFSLRSAWCIAPLSTPMLVALKGLNIAHAKVIPNFVDVQPELNVQSSASDDFESLRLLYVGWLIPAKGIVELLEAVQKVERVNLTLIGPSLSQYVNGNAAWVDDLIRDRGLGDRVTYLGRMDTDRTRSAFREHDALILPSHQEGFPYVVLEGMEAGIPVIATKVGAIPEIIRDELDGYLIDVKDVESMAQRITDLRDDSAKRTSMGKSARLRAIEQFSSERVVGMWVDLYRQAASGGEFSSHKEHPVVDKSN